MSNVPPHLAAEVFSEAMPAEDPVLYGHATMEPRGGFEARSFATFRLTYTCGRFGLDDTGSIRIVFRFTADGGPLQMDDPAAPNYVTAATSKGVALRLSFDADGHQRPWYQALTCKLIHGYLSEGERVTVVFGETGGGSPGMRLQSMCESRFTFRVLADVCATGHYVPVSESPTIAIVPGPPVLWKAVLPTLRRPGEVFRLGIKAEDAWGNPSDQVDTALALASDAEISGLPRSVRFARGERSVVVDGLRCETEGALSIAVLDALGNELAHSDPLVIRAGDEAGYWADMHGQSGESVGINTARDYFLFARDLAFLDATSHQANDFQINNAFWAHINELTAELHEDDRFLTLPGYEWSGNTGVGGDRNVYFRSEGRPIRRSSHALLPDRSDIASDAQTARNLFEALRDEDCLVYAHIGGRPADVAYAHDPRIETAMEIHSAWGTFEWLMADCFDLGHRVGVVANSDGHKGRPGASYPGASEFGAYGGLTCFLMDRLTRDDLFDCLKRRRHYATTGNRIYIDVRARADEPFAFFEYDPKVHDCGPVDRNELTMGDIARSRSETVRVSFDVRSASPIECVELLNGMALVDHRHGFSETDLGSRIRVLWRGAVTKGRGARARWHGTARFDGATIERSQQINGWNPDRPLHRADDRTLTWESVTAGNFGAFDAWVTENTGARLDLETNLCTGSVSLADVGLEPVVFDAGGLDLALEVRRLPETNGCYEMSGEFAAALSQAGDNPLWLRVVTEDGFVAWTSPIYLFR